MKLYHVMNKIGPRGWFSLQDMEVYNELVSKLPDNGTFVECGIKRGRSFCSVAQELRVKNCEVFCVDHDENIIPEFMENLDKYGYSDIGVQIIVSDAGDAAAKFEDNSVDMLFLDDSHIYEDVLRRLNVWMPKLKSGGTISGHDYHGNPEESEGVYRAVNEYFDENVKSYEDSLIWHTTKS